MRGPKRTSQSQSEVQLHPSRSSELALRLESKSSHECARIAPFARELRRAMLGRLCCCLAARSLEGLEGLESEQSVRCPLAFAPRVGSKGVETEGVAFAHGVGSVSVAPLLVPWFTLLAVQDLKIQVLTTGRRCFRFCAARAADHPE